ncbi:MAG: LysM peptidoglycan-binding domain-containing protein [Bacilli bacterium]|nr:LysM peptidoglycan-binding domain-containing protein [Bacilli bacterium]
MKKQYIKMNRQISMPLKYGTMYIVEPSDNLYRIASRFNTTVDKLRELNNLDSDLLHVGNIIVVDDLYNPENESVYKRYIIKKDDTIYSIAYNYRMTTNELLEINNKLNDDIKAGEIIYVYNNPPLLSDEILYTVKTGDSLYSIANNYETTVANLMKNNNLTDDFLSVGMELIIKVKSLETDDETEIYTVVPGDSLYSIGQKKGISAHELKQLNNLTSDSLSIGEQLLVPKENPHGKGS